jgi:hypothetical protein
MGHHWRNAAVFSQPHSNWVKYGEYTRVTKDLSIYAVTSKPEKKCLRNQVLV